MSGSPHRTLLVYGGTFDPPHLGHVKSALTVQQQIKCDEFIILPCKTPVLKAPTQTTNEHRINMVKLAFPPNIGFKVDLREIERDSPSYMVETLRSIRCENHPNDSITLLMGFDAFLDLPKWYHWNELLTLAHLLVISRHHHSNTRGLSDPLNEILETHETVRLNDLTQFSHGKIYRLDAGDYPFSSSDLRRQIRLRENVQSKLPKEVYQYILKHQLYC